jgi:hypothetical protein
MLEKVPGDAASWCWPYLVAKPSIVRVDADGLACPLHRPMVHSYQTRGHGLMLSAALSHHEVGCGGTFPGMRSPRAWILAGVMIV